eukprot:jgi/Hompol1/2307/HPOL_002892-RA
MIGKAHAAVLPCASIRILPSRMLQRTQQRAAVWPIHCRSFASTAAHRPAVSASQPRSSIARAAALLVAGTAVSLYLYDRKAADRAALTAIRSIRTAATLLTIMIDYKWSLRSSIASLGSDAYNESKSQAHQRSADRLLALFQAQGGIYIKLGQHIAALVYLLPIEYTQTMRVLQDQCIPTPKDQLAAMFHSEVGVGMDDVFESFEDTPIGVASLAQVHRATLKPDALRLLGIQDDSNDASLEHRQVAVKLQHAALDEHAQIDIATCSFFVRLVKRVFPAFEFDWLATELQLSLPQELDFMHEASNARKAKSLFSMLYVPKVHWASRRVILMEYVEGGKIDDPNYMRKHNIPIDAVSTKLAKAYSEMIFLYGFVHCDPHPGNIFVRPTDDRRTWLERFFRTKPRNFDIVLLDHGLYRTLTSEFRLDYAHLWSSIIRNDEAGIENYTYRIFLSDERISKDGIDHHRLFASMVSGRSWETITSSEGLTQLRSINEVHLVQKNASTDRFLYAIADVLAKLPRELLLLLKTNDLLRAIDDALGVAQSQSHMIRSVAIVGEYCALAIRKEHIQLLINQHRPLNSLVVIHPALIVVHTWP